MFTHFEILKPHQIFVRDKRSVSGINPGAITTSFTAFQKRFTLLLTPGVRVLHSDVRAVQLDEVGRAIPYDIHNSRFYSGTVDGDRTHEVVASESDGVWMVHIHTPEEFYSVEPLSLYDSKANQRDMIVYRAGDVRAENHTRQHQFCDGIDLDKILKPMTRTVKLGKLSPRKEQQLSASAWEYLKSKHPLDGVLDAALNITGPALVHHHARTGRVKRKATRSRGHALKVKDCDMLAVTDYTLYKGLGLAKPAIVVQSLVHVYHIVDRIFRSTDFGHPFHDGYGVVLRGIAWHGNFSEEPLHYNSANLSKTAMELLIAMTRQFRFTDYCLAHLSVQRNLGDTLGLATVAGAGPFWANGLCAGLNFRFARNVGLSTVLNSAGQPLAIMRYALVVAHEIGHNWGAQHDPLKSKDGHECNPPSDRGGRFLMWPYSGLAKDPNSERFSPCSLEDIRKILHTRAHLCLLDAAVTHYVCGNGMVERSEECDPGFAALGTDSCCSRDCRLRPGAQCSPANAPCCTEQCQIAPATHRCYPKGDRNLCFEASFCSGNDSMYCPQPTPLPNRSPCADQGWCWFGRCLSFCEKTGTSHSPVRDLRSCECDHNATAMCRHCCLDKGTPGGKCQIVGGALQDGEACLLGHCQSGICVAHDNADTARFPRMDNFLREQQQAKAKAGYSSRRFNKASYGLLGWAFICVLLLSFP